MYKILLCCVSGVTTNKLVKAVKESAKQKNIKVMCWAVGSKLLDYHGQMLTVFY